MGTFDCAFVGRDHCANVCTNDITLSKIGMVYAGGTTFRKDSINGCTEY